MNKKRINFNNEEKDKIRKMYLEEKISPSDIGKFFGCSSNPIYRLLEDINIIRKYPWNKGLTESTDERVKRYREKYNKNKEEISKKISVALTGIIRSKETSDKHSQIMKDKYKSGEIIPPMLGKHHSEESKQKIKEARSKQISPMKGRHFSKESMEKRSKTRRERDGYASWSKGLTKETNESLKRMANNKVRSEKISEGLKRAYFEGRKIAPSKIKGVSDKIKLTNKILYSEGKIKSWNKGLTKDTDDRIRKISESKKGINNPMFGKYGEKNHQWLGGKSFEPYTKEFNKQFKLAIKQRDGFLCLKCMMRDEDSKILFKKGLAVHHINYIKENTFFENCCALCVRCNAEVNQNRKQWTKFFQSVLSERYNYKYTEEGDIVIDI